MVQAQGFLLLTIPNSSLTNTSTGQTTTGQLSLECVTLPIPASAPSPTSTSPTSQQPDRDVWLVLRVGSFEMPISPTAPITKSREKNIYTFSQPGTEASGTGEYVLRLPPAGTEHDTEDLETLEVLFEQYGIVLSEGYETRGYGGDSKTEAGAATGSSVAAGGVYGATGIASGAASSDYFAPQGPHGSLVLVDETDGHVLGTLDQNFTIKEDATVNEKGREKDPVIVELPVEGAPEEIHVRSVRENDPILRAAGLASRGIMYATDAIASGLTYAADTYVSRSTPREKPIVFSETTRKNVKRVHKISGQAVVVTSKTVGMIHGYIDRIVDGVTGNRSQQGQGQGQGPPLPPRSVGGGAGTSPVVMTPPALPPRPGSKTAETTYGPPGYAAATGSGGAPGQPQKKPRLLNRLLLSTDLLLTTLENAATKLIDSGTENLSKGLGHKYGEDMGSASLLLGQSCRNVGVVYIDARGVGRRALIRRAGKKVVKGMMGGKQVVFGQEGQGTPSRPVSPMPTGSGGGGYAGPQAGPSGSVPGGFGSYKN